MNRFRNTMVVLFFILLSTGAKGQFNYKPGKLITNTNDTLVGLIRDGGGLKNSKYGKFKPNKDSEPIKYYPKDIKSYWFTDDKYYSSEIIPIKKDSVPLFCEVLIQGSVSLLYPIIGKELPYFLKLENNSLVGLENNSKIYVQTIPGENALTYKIVEYKDTLHTIFAKAGIPDIQFVNLEYNDKSLQRITKTYIDSTCKEDNCITYERNLRINKASIGFFTGLQFSAITLLNAQLNYDFMPDKGISFPIGFMFNDPLNLWSDRLSFQMELMYCKYSYNMEFLRVPADSANQQMTSNVLAIPLFFKYGIKIKKFTPTMGIGKEIGLVINSKLPYIQYEPPLGLESPYTITNYQIHWQQKGGWFFDLGLTYQIHPKYALFSSIRYQRQRNLVTEEGETKNYSYYKLKNENLGKEYLTDIVSLRIGVSF